MQCDRDVGYDCYRIVLFMFYKGGEVGFMMRSIAEKI